MWDVSLFTGCERICAPAFIQQNLVHLFCWCTSYKKTLQYNSDLRGGIFSSEIWQHLNGLLYPSLKKKTKWKIQALNIRTKISLQKCNSKWQMFFQRRRLFRLFTSVSGNYALLLTDLQFCGHANWQQKSLHVIMSTGTLDKKNNVTQ